MLLQHYGSPTTLGQKCRATLESLQLEIGCRGNPLQECYRSRGILATPTWITSIWERCQQMELTFHLCYDSLQFPWENDTEIITLFLQHGVSGMTLQQMNRCRLALNVIFLSDIVTAGGRRLEHLVRGDRQGQQSNLAFAREQPSCKDWEQWDLFWTGWLHKNNSIPTLLGPWLQQSHQQWDWFYDPQTNSLWKSTEDGWTQYAFHLTGINTRRSRTYKISGLWASAPDQLLPASVATSDTNWVQVTDTGTPLAPTPTNNPKRPISFWEFVWQQRGMWMWEHVEGKHHGMSWINRAMANNTAIMVTDGSYNKCAPTISGAGWILACTHSLQMVRGSFYEESQKASSYRGELLGLTAIHHLAAFAIEFYGHNKATRGVHCDNKGALHQASLKHRRVRTGCKHSDLLRNLRYIKHMHNFITTYSHVKAHLDDTHAYDDLTLVQQFNVICDTLAKQAVQTAMTSTNTWDALHQLLPCEQAALIVNGQKQTTDVSVDLCFQLGRREAKKFFTRPIRRQGNSNKGGLGWSTGRFDCIDWETLHRVISQKPAMYGVWLSKQTIGICATRHSMARILGTTDDRCPNCLHGPERNMHLNHCKDQGRTLLFESDLAELRSWLLKTTDNELAYWLYHYWLLRGEYSMMSLGMTSAAMIEIAEEFDMIGWDDTLHGRLPLALLRYQTSYWSDPKTLAHLDILSVQVRKR